MLSTYLILKLLLSYLRKPATTALIQNHKFASIYTVITLKPRLSISPDMTQSGGVRALFPSTAARLGIFITLIKNPIKRSF